MVMYLLKMSYGMSGIFIIIIQYLATISTGNMTYTSLLWLLKWAININFISI